VVLGLDAATAEGVVEFYALRGRHALVLLAEEDQSRCLHLLAAQISEKYYNEQKKKRRSRRDGRFSKMQQGPGGPWRWDLH
jgi:hypothetical protein